MLIILGDDTIHEERYQNCHQVWFVNHGLKDLHNAEMSSSLTGEADSCGTIVVDFVVMGVMRDGGDNLNRSESVHVESISSDCAATRQGSGSDTTCRRGSPG